STRKRRRPAPANMLIDATLRANPPAVEDGTVQTVVVLAARLQDLDENELWGFWETLGNHVDRVAAGETGPVRSLMEWMLNGRAWFGGSVRSNWTTCTFIANAQL